MCNKDESCSCSDDNTANCAEGSEPAKEGTKPEEDARGEFVRYVADGVKHAQAMYTDKLPPEDVAILDEAFRSVGDDLTNKLYPAFEELGRSLDAYQRQLSVRLSNAKDYSNEHSILLHNITRHTMPAVLTEVLMGMVMGMVEREATCVEGNGQDVLFTWMEHYYNNFRVIKATQIHQVTLPGKEVPQA